MRAKDLKDAISLGEARLSPRRAALAPARSVTTLASPQCQCEVAALLKDKVLCGHALSNDLKVRESDRARRARMCIARDGIISRAPTAAQVLLLTHPKNMIRDTATYGPLMRTSRNGR